jgi:hypothetical protein
MSPKNVTTKVKKSQGKNTGVVFWHTSNGSVPVAQVAQVFSNYGEREPEALGIRAVFSRIERVYSRDANKTMFVRRVAATKAELSRTETLDVVEVGLPSLTSSPRTYTVVGQITMERDKAGYCLSYKCQCGQTVFVQNDALVPTTPCGCSVAKWADEIGREWMQLRGAGAMMDGGTRGMYYIRLFLKHGAIGLSESGRPYYYPATDNFSPWKIVQECGDRLYILPLTEEAAQDVHDLSVAAFMSELNSLRDEVEGWEETVRDSTKQKRIEQLLDLKKRLGLYDVILGAAKDELFSLTGDIETSILKALGIGDDNESYETVDTSTGIVEGEVE